MTEGQRENVPTYKSPGSSSSLEDSRHPTGHHQNSFPPPTTLDKEAIRRKRNRESMARARKKMKEKEIALDCQRLRQKFDAAAPDQFSQSFLSDENNAMESGGRVLSTVPQRADIFPGGTRTIQYLCSAVPV